LEISITIDRLSTTSPPSLFTGSNIDADPNQPAVCAFYLQLFIPYRLPCPKTLEKRLCPGNTLRCIGIQVENIHFQKGIFLVSEQPHGFGIEP
jgi:hypothetical protein